MLCARYTFLIKGKHCPRQTQIETHTHNRPTHTGTYTRWQSKAIQCSDSWQTNLFMHCTILINNFHVQHWGRHRERHTHAYNAYTPLAAQRSAQHSKHTHTHTAHTHTRCLVACAYKKCKVCLSNEIRRHVKKKSSSYKQNDWLDMQERQGVCREGAGRRERRVGESGSETEATGQRCRILICWKRLGVKCQRQARQGRQQESKWGK